MAKKPRDLEEAARLVTPAAVVAAGAAPLPPKSKGEHDYEDEKDSSPAPHHPLTPPVRTC